MFKKYIALITSIFMLNLFALETASAITMQIKCETRGTSRSKISVDALGLSGTFVAKVYSGSAFQPSKKPIVASRGQVEFDFDSDPVNVRAGATAIPATFIKNRRVSGVIRRAGSNAFVGGMMATCTAR